MKRIMYLLLIICLFMLTSCQKKPSPLDTPVTIKVLAWNKDIFYQQYGDLFLIDNKVVDLDVISVTDYLKDKESKTEVFERVIKEQHPDVALISTDSYEILQDKNMLTPLLPFIKKSDVELSDITPAVVNFLKDETGELYGLAATFVGKAVYYNKKLFDQFGIPLPNDSMTWDEIFSLAKRFPKEIDRNTPLLGLYDRDFSNPMVMALKIGGGGGLSFFNGKEITMNSQSWNEIFQSVIDCVKIGACGDYTAQVKDQGWKQEKSLASTYPFLKGNIAMAIDDSKLYTLIDRKAEQYKNIDWDVVSFPIRAEHPDMGNGMDIEEIFVINSESNKKEAAWELINFVNGNGYAKIFSRVNTLGLSAREPSSDQGEHNIHAFYNLDQMMNTTMTQMRKLPRPVVEKLDELSLKYLADVYEDKLTVSEMLNQFQSNLQDYMSN